MKMATRYCGRFAPSPTGPLHFGSLAAAVASYVDARAAGGVWLVRIEDIDSPRTVSGAADGILRTLEAYGLHWDGEVVYQSRRLPLYQAALDRLREGGFVYPCGCSRKEIADSTSRRPASGALPYPGTCRQGLGSGRPARSWRLRVPEGEVWFDDRVQGRVGESVAVATGDFVLARPGPAYAYQLAVVVDDDAQRVTDVVRGADLLASTPRQIVLQRLLGLPQPGYLHVPVAGNREGEKLSKQTLAAPVDDADPEAWLRRALNFLGHPPPARHSAAEMRAWAIANWNVDRIPKVRGITCP